MDEILLFGICISISIIICIIYKYSPNPNHNPNQHMIEPYDVKVQPSSINKCGQLCTGIVGCYGYAHNNLNTCYLSQKHILGQALETTYANEYKDTDYRCNKIRALQGLNDSHVPEALKENAFYTCSDSELGKYHLELLTDKIYQKVGEYDDIDKIDVPLYKVIDFDWSKNKYIQLS